MPTPQLKTPDPKGLDLGHAVVRPHGGETPNDFDPGKGKNVGNSRGPVMGYGKHKGSYHG